MTWAAAWLTYRACSWMSKGQDVIKSYLLQQLLASILESQYTYECFLTICTCLFMWQGALAYRFVCTLQSWGHLFQRKEQSAPPSTHVTRYMNTPHCLLWAGWPGPTLAPALSNTRCRSASAAGAGGMWCLRVCVCWWGGCGGFVCTRVCV